jgi:hypothetical protein
MSNPYQRTSRVDALATLHAPLRLEAQRVATAQGVGDLAAATRFCVVTHSVRDPPGLFVRALTFGNADREQWTVILVTRDAVLAGVSGDATGTHVFLLPLATLTLDDISAVEKVGGPGVGLASPSLARGGSGVGTYVVYLDSPATRDVVTRTLRSALAERRSG